MRAQAVTAAVGWTPARLGMAGEERLHGRSGGERHAIEPANVIASTRRARYWRLTSLRR